MKPINFRPKKWLFEDLQTFGTAKGLENKTEVLHEYIKDLKNRAKQAETDLRAWKLNQQNFKPKIESKEKQCYYFKFEKVTEEYCQRCQKNRLVVQCPLINRM